MDKDSGLFFWFNCKDESSQWADTEGEGWAGYGSRRASTMNPDAVFSNALMESALAGSSKSNQSTILRVASGSPPRSPRAPTKAEEKEAEVRLALDSPATALSKKHSAEPKMHGIAEVEFDSDSVKVTARDPGDKDEAGELKPSELKPSELKPPTAASAKESKEQDINREAGNKEGNVESPRAIAASAAESKKESPADAAAEEKAALSPRGSSSPRPAASPRAPLAVEPSTSTFTPASAPISAISDATVKESVGLDDAATHGADAIAEEKVTAADSPKSAVATTNTAVVSGSPRQSPRPSASAKVDAAHEAKEPSVSVEAEAPTSAPSIDNTEE